MADYSKFIDPKRRAVPTPDSMVDENGRCVFGTFDKEFKQMELLKLKKPTKAPDCFKRLKLTLWEASEVHFKEGVLLAVVCDMGIFGKTMNVFYDKRNKKVYCWDTNLKSKETVIAPNLINGAIAEAHTPVSFVRYENNFQDGKAHLTGSHKGKCFIDSKTYSDEPTIEYDITMQRLSDPCVVSIPFPYSDNRPLYSQKDIFKAEGYIILNGEKLVSDEFSTSIIDDHRGYYPRHAHYDWVTTMGLCEIDGVKKYLGFNLTRNQSIDQEKYNENILWLEGKSSLLPPVTFTRTVETKDFKNSGYSEWIVKDEHDMVNIKFKVYNLNAMITHAVIINIDYYITFGELEGYIRDEDGKKYVLDGMLGMGEDKTLLL